MASKLYTTLPQGRKLLQAAIFQLPAPVVRNFSSQTPQALAQLSTLRHLQHSSSNVTNVCTPLSPWRIAQPGKSLSVPPRSTIIPKLRKLHTTAPCHRDHQFDTLKLVQRLQDEGFTEQQSVAVMNILSDVIEERYGGYYCRLGCFHSIWSFWCPELNQRL